MIERAIIEEKVDDYSYRIRIPRLNKMADTPLATSFSDLYIAKVAFLPNSKPNFQVGDAVFVGFEYSEAEPVIIGQLSRLSKTENNAFIVCDSLKVVTDTVLSQQTSIGDVKGAEILCLSGATSNIQSQINILSDSIAKLDDRLHTYTYGCVSTPGPNALPTAQDAKYVLYASLGKLTLSGWQLKAADVDGDGKITSDDSSLIQQFVSNPVTGKYGRIGETFIYKEE